MPLFALEHDILNLVIAIFVRHGVDFEKINSEFTGQPCNQCCESMAASLLRKQIEVILDFPLCLRAFIGFTKIVCGCASLFIRDGGIRFILQKKLEHFQRVS